MAVVIAIVLDNNVLLKAWVMTNFALQEKANRVRAAVMLYRLYTMFME